MESSDTASLEMDQLFHTHSGIGPGRFDDLSVNIIALDVCFTERSTKSAFLWHLKMADRNQGFPVFFRKEMTLHTRSHIAASIASAN